VTWDPLSTFAQARNPKKGTSVPAKLELSGVGAGHGPQSGQILEESTQYCKIAVRQGHLKTLLWMWERRGREKRMRVSEGERGEKRV
jgi:hypothetical protein